MYFFNFEMRFLENDFEFPKSLSDFLTYRRKGINHGDRASDRGAEKDKVREGHCAGGPPRPSTDDRRRDRRPALLGFYTTRSATLLAVSTRVEPAPNQKEPLCSGSFSCLQIAQSD
jgi:hypothetical protein